MAKQTKKPRKTAQEKKLDRYAEENLKLSNECELRSKEIAYLRNEIARNEYERISFLEEREGLYDRNNALQDALVVVRSTNGKLTDMANVRASRIGASLMKRLKECCGMLR